MLALACAVNSNNALAALSDTKKLAGRLMSCDEKVVRAATQQVLSSLEQLDVGVLYTAANALQGLGEREDAAFLSLASLLRIQRHRAFQRGDAAQALGTYSGFLSGMMMPYVESDPDFAERVVRRVVEWDRVTPDANRDGAEAKKRENAAKLAEIQSVLTDLPKKLREDPGRVAKARERVAMSARVAADSRSKRCAPGMLDPKDVAGTEDRIGREAERFVTAHPLVQARWAGRPVDASVSSRQVKHNDLSGRLTISVHPQRAGERPAHGERFFAEVDVTVRVAADRTVEGIDYTLACLTNLWIGERDARWKDVCVDDPAAQRP